MCEELKECAYNDKAAANITFADVQPAQGPVGTTFVISSTFAVTNTIATGEVVLEILPPDGMPFGGGDLIVDATPNK